MKKTSVLAVLALSALAACSAPSRNDSPEVASISTPSTSAGSTQASAPAEDRPRERLDMTPEDQDALRAPLKKCMGQFGLDDSGRAIPPGSTQPPQEKVDSALKTCGSKIPLPPWEKDAANPEAVDFANRVVQCLRDKGVRYAEVQNTPGATTVGYALGGPNNDSESITLGLKYVKECEVTASRK
ncbi:hypothetical protein [Lentzea sp. E54]|uniref:hypothetical protein n=1 Tax=Lentzea xerophila TaxID=3435883 RepID=UPI003DA43A65